MTTRYDQTENIRDNNSTTPFRSVWDETTAEAAANRYQKYRQQLTRDRIAEEADNEETNLRGRDNAKTAIDFLPDRIKKPVSKLNRWGSKLPIPDNIPSILSSEAVSLLSPLKPLTSILETAEKNRLKMQDAIAPKIANDDCGLTVDSPFLKISIVSRACRPTPKPTTEPFAPPVPQGWPPGAPDIQAPEWRSMMVPENAGKVFTLKWHYSGWSSPTIVNHPSTGQTIQLSGVTFLGDNFTGVRGAGNFNPQNNHQEIAPFLQGYQHSGIIGRLIRPDNRWQKGWTNLAPTPIEPINPTETASMNVWFPAGFSRQNYWGALTVLSRQRFRDRLGNTVWAEFIALNFRADITIGLSSAWDSGWWAANYPNRLITQFFESYHWNTLNSEVGLVEPEIDNDPVKRIAPKPIDPPPPPPKKRCDCMSNCCPNNQSDITELKRLIRSMNEKVDKMQKMVGEPESVPLWDVELSTQGKKVETKKPESITKHLALINERLEMSLRIIGIHDLPIDVEASASNFENVARMLMSTPNDTLKSLGKLLLDRTKSRTKITSVIDYITWVQETLHEKLGGWEQEMNIADIDLLKDGNQSSKIYFPSIAEMLNATTKYSIDSAVRSEAIVNIATRALLEVVAIKKMLGEIGYQVDSTADYLGYEYVESSEEMNVLANLKQRDLSKLEDILKESKIPIKKITLAKGEQPLESKLVMIQQAAAIIKAVNTIPLGNDEKEGKEIIKELLKASLDLGAGDNWDEWLPLYNETLKQKQIPLELKEI